MRCGERDPLHERQRRNSRKLLSGDAPASDGTREDANVKALALEKILVTLRAGGPHASETLKPLIHRARLLCGNPRPLKMRVHLLPDIRLAKTFRDIFNSVNLMRIRADRKCDTEQDDD